VADGCGHQTDDSRIRKSRITAWVPTTSIVYYIALYIYVRLTAGADYSGTLLEPAPLALLLHYEQREITASASQDERRARAASNTANGMVAVAAILYSIQRFIERGFRGPLESAANAERASLRPEMPNHWIARPHKPRTNGVLPQE